MNYVEFKDYIRNHPEMTKTKTRCFINSVLKTAKPKSALYVACKYEHAYLLYADGQYDKMKKLLDPIIYNYQDYEFCNDLVSCHFSLGVVYQIEDNQEIAREYFQQAYSISKKHKKEKLYFLCLNNIASTYAAEEKYEMALKYFDEASKYIGESKYRAVLMALNKSVCLFNLEKKDEALDLFKKCVDLGGLTTNLEKQVKTWGLQLYYHLEDKEKFNEYLNYILELLETVEVGDSVDALETLLDYSINFDNEDIYNKTETVLIKYLNDNPNEYKFGLKLSNYQYKHAKKIKDDMLTIKYLESVAKYSDLVIKSLEKQNASSLSREVKLNSLRNKNEERKAQNELLNKLSLTDSLTGVNNRHAFNMLLGKKNKFKKCNSLLCAFIDLDNFKMINDKYSHLEGDNVLAKLGKVLSKACDNSFEAYRYGGDEFIVFITDTDLDKALERLNHIHEQISQIRYGNNEILSCSIGASYMNENIDIKELVETADSKLYVGKENKGKIIF